MSEDSYRALVFDIGGVVTQTPSGGVTVPVVFSIASRYHVDGDRLRRMLWENDPEFKVGRLTPDQYLLPALEKLGRKLVDGDTAYGLLHDPLRCVIYENTEVVGIIKLLRRKYKAFALTNITKPQLDYVTELGLRGLFDGFFASCEIGLKKPDPKAYEFVLAKIGLRADQVVFFDNKKANVDAAEKLRIKAVMFESPDDIRSLLA